MPSEALTSTPTALTSMAEPALGARLHALLEAVQRDTGVPGIGVALSVRGRHTCVSMGKLASDANHPMDDRSRFQLGCITKLLTALVAGELVQQKRLDPEAPLERYLPELKGALEGRSIAVWHALSHTSGVPGLDLSDPRVSQGCSWSRLVEHLARSRQLFRPGSVFSYVHLEYVLVGEIIERLTGRSISELYREMIFEPLGLSTGSVRADQKSPERFVVDHLAGEGQRFTRLRPTPFGPFWRASLSDLTASLPDLLKLSDALGGFREPPSGFVSTEAIDFVRKQVVKLPQTFGGSRPEQLPGAFGLGCAAYRGWLLGHNGSARGQTCGLRFDPRHGMALVIGLNSWQPHFRDSLINHLFGVLRGRPLPTLEPRPLEFELEELVGSYRGPVGTVIRVAAEGSRLRLGIEGARSRFTLEMRRDCAGILEPVAEVGHHSIGFFRDPAGGEPCLMFGLTAFRRDDEVRDVAAE